MQPLRWNAWWWAIGLLLVAVILFGTLAPPRAVPSLHLNDKVEHFLAHLGLALWFAGLVPRSRLPWVAVALVAFGGGIEIAQWLMGFGRDADWHDWYADCVGVGVGSLLAWLGLSAWATTLEGMLGGSRA